MTEVINPATEELITSVESHSAEATKDAIGRAAYAFTRWRTTAPAERAELLRAFARDVAEAGHTIGNARGEAGNVRDVLNYFAGGVERHLGDQIPVAGGVNVTFNEPLGVVGIIVPWNFPMPIAGWGFSPALAA
ncbi:Aldehyde dehydrogenase family protein, partial [Brevibacterium linens ATCC 9172]